MRPRLKQITEEFYYLIPRRDHPAFPELSEEEHEEEKRERVCFCFFF